MYRFIYVDKHYHYQNDDHQIKHQMFLMVNIFQYLGE